MTEIPKEITAAAILISCWMKEQGHERWELFDLCSRNHATELEKSKAEMKDSVATLQKLDRLISLAQKSNDDKTDAEIAASAEFNEAMAYTNADLLEAELAQARSELEKERQRCKLLLIEQAHEEEVRGNLKHCLAQTTLRLDEWKAIANQLYLALGNDGIRANNPLSHDARVNALKAYDALKA